MLFRTRISRALLMGMLSCTGSLVESDENTNEEHVGRLDSIYLGFALWWRLEKKSWISRNLGRLKAFCVQRNKCVLQPVRSHKFGA